MNSLFVRQTHWDIPCRQASIRVSIEALHQALKVSGSKTTTATSTTFFNNDWHEFKVATYGGRQVLLLLEVCRGEARFSSFDSPTLEELILRQREYRFQLKSCGKRHTYSVFGYTPFRPIAYTAYQQAEAPDEKNKHLKSHLLYHISELANRVDWLGQEVISIEKLKVIKEKKARLGGMLQASFDLQFQTNFFIPEFMGLGRGATMGLGVIRPLRKASSGSR